MLFINRQIIKSANIFFYGLASFFLYGLTKQIYINYTNSGINDKNKEEPVKKELQYNYKYYDEFNNLPNEELSKDHIKSFFNNILFENTPKGKVIMYYDNNTDSFIYYCDLKYIPYLFLETVARKYAITFNCKQLVVDIKKEIENATTKNEKEKETQFQEKNHKNDNGIFASFKSYNIKGSGGSKNPNKKYIIREFANRYSYRGKINDFNILKKNDYIIEKPKEKIDYNTFKKLMDEKLLKN